MQISLNLIFYPLIDTKCNFRHSTLEFDTREKVINLKCCVTYTVHTAICKSTCQSLSNMACLHYAKTLFSRGSNDLILSGFLASCFAPPSPQIGGFLNLNSVGRGPWSTVSKASRTAFFLALLYRRSGLLLYFRQTFYPQPIPWIICEESIRSIVDRVSFQHI